MEEEGAPADHGWRRLNDYSVQTEAGHWSNAYASVQLVRLDELVATPTEMRRLNFCLRGLPNQVDEMEEHIASWVQVLRTLVGAGIRSVTGSAASQGHDHSESLRF